MVSLLGLSLFASVGREVFEQETAGFDEAARTWVLAHQFAALSTAFRLITSVGSAYALTLLAVGMAAWASYSFPSGHATSSTAVLVTLGYILAREGLLSHRLAILLGFLGPLLVGLSRIYLDVHRTTDVLGGWGLGLVVAALSGAAYEHLRGRIPRTAPGV